MALNVVVAGSSGFLGTHLVKELRGRGHTVTRLVRREPSANDEAQWNPAGGTVPGEVIAAADVVINLAGSPTAGNPHSKKWARELRSSRVDTTTTLATAIAASENKPAFMAGNGISFYGGRGQEVLDEGSESRGDALLTSVTREWQAATEPAQEAGARVCVLRTSPVLDKDSPPLKLMLLPFKLGLGVRLGDGEQHFPNISLRDWIGAVVFLTENDEVSGPVNLCSPSTPTNGEFTAALADAVGRKARLFVPAPLLSVAAGDLSSEVLGSINAVPRVLLDAGYRFHDDDVRDVIAAALN